MGEQRVSTARLPLPVAWLIVVAAGVLVYWNSFGGALVFDAITSIVENKTIRHLSPLGPVLLPPLAGATVEGRPLLNLSFALNYAAGELDPWGYHFVNLAIHILAALALFGIVRRTLLLPAFAPRMGVASTGLALVCALVWLVHPLQTESVTNVVQRAESLMGWLFLLSFYFAVRGFTSTRPGVWKTGAVLVCLLGMAAKEVMAIAPLTILLYDRVFISTSWREAFSRRGGFYIALFLTWGLLAMLVVWTGTHGKTVGLGLGLGPWDYAKIQCGAVLHYLRLSVWPSPLVADYGVLKKVDDWSFLPNAFGVAALFAAGMIAFRFRPWIGFLALTFFALLAPTSSVLPIVTQSMAEHRMYLPLAPLVTLAVIGGYLLLRRGAIPVLALVLVVFSGLTVARNADYASDFTFWSDCVEKWPRSHRSQNNLGLAFYQKGDADAAMTHYRRALEIDPGYEQAHNNLGYALAEKGALDEAIAHYREALALKPDYAKAHNNLGLALGKSGKLDEAIACYERALEISPDYDRAHNNLAGALFQKGRVDEAIAHYREALRIQRGNAKTHHNLGVVLLESGRVSEAIAEFRAAIEIDPNYAKARDNLNKALRRETTEGR